MVMHIHDEVVIEAPLADPTHTLDNAISIMCTPAPWAKGLPLNAALDLQPTIIKKIRAADMTNDKIINRI
ncbi:MAG: hypothetical protein ACLTE2_04620 [Eubacteriales bacterium]